MTVHTLMSEATWSQTSASKTHNKAPRYSLQCMDAERYLLPDVSTLSLLAKRENWCALWVFLGILLCPAVHKTRRLPFLDTFLLRRAAQELQMSTAYFHDYSRWWQTELNSCTNVKKGLGAGKGACGRRKKDGETDLLHEKRTQSWRTWHAVKCKALIPEMAVSPLNPNMWDFGSKVAEYWVLVVVFLKRVAESEEVVSPIGLITAREKGTRQSVRLCTERKKTKRNDSKVFSTLLKRQCDS